ncbi:uncharacterized protein LOC110105802 [Dendrobium catenatum]|uniref:VQ domain-containing protein n=1 Tax=Dendrobium catenatum TaxID=906689 RepID=A0A2I0VI91_9ASPA|nr:uncharacterized protein LOC110105802 [Dendrobium catenatum]PKU63093.1 hypothetical protein MA16_Dca024522 [Dendrobium catenatum]
MSMDSATSESFQSSNGGGGDFDDFDSRQPPDTISSFLNLPPPQPPPIPQTSRNIFDPFPSYQTNSFLSDLDATTWPPPPQQPPQLPSSAPNSTANAASSSVAAPRASKKRARASRRAPTTVLTTDTSNFRAMVQEFTGIPAPPFTTSSVFSRPRLDLFHHSASSSTPAFLLRPFAQKRQATGASGSLTGISSNTLPSTSGVQNQNFLLNNTQNPSFNLQSLLQEQQRATGLFHWPAGAGYAGGELGSVIAGASAESDSKRIGSCKTDQTGSSHSEKQVAADGFPAAPAAAAAARGEGGMDAWQLSSD